MDSSEARSSQPCNDLREEYFEPPNHQTAQALRKEGASGEGWRGKTECDGGAAPGGLAGWQWLGGVHAEPCQSGEGVGTRFHMEWEAARKLSTEARWDLAFVSKSPLS